MTTHSWPFKAGEAVLYLPSSARMHEAPRPQLAIVIACKGFKTSIQKDGAKQPISVQSCRLAYAGYCATCQVPAIVGAGSVLICPRCQAEAVPIPPPDLLVARWWPAGNWHTPMIAHRAAVDFRFTLAEARDDAAETIERLYTAMLDLLDLPAPLQRSSDDLQAWLQDRRAIDQLKRCALLGDAQGFYQVYQELKASQEPVTSPAFGLAELLDEEGEDIGPSRRMVFAPLAFERPLDDSQPDGADEVTRWLERQFGG